MSGSAKKAKEAQDLARTPVDQAAFDDAMHACGGPKDDEKFRRGIITVHAEQTRALEERAKERAAGKPVGERTSGRRVVIRRDVTPFSIYTCVNKREQDAMVIVWKFQEGEMDARAAHEALAAHQQALTDASTKKRKTADAESGKPAPKPRSADMSDEFRLQKAEYVSTIKKLLKGELFLVISARSFESASPYRQFTAEGIRKIKSRKAVSWLVLVRILAEHHQIPPGTCKVLEDLTQVLKPEDVKAIVARAERIAPSTIPHPPVVGSSLVLDGIIAAIRQRYGDNEELMEFLAYVHESIKDAPSFAEFLRVHTPNTAEACANLKEFKKSFFSATDHDSRAERERNILTLMTKGITAGQIDRLRLDEIQNTLREFKMAAYLGEPVSDNTARLIACLSEEDDGFHAKLREADEEGRTCAAMLDQLAAKVDEETICEDHGVESFDEVTMPIPEAQRRYKEIKTLLAGQRAPAAAKPGLTSVGYLNARLANLVERQAGSVEEFYDRFVQGLPVESDKKNTTLCLLASNRKQFVELMHSNPNKVPDFSDANIQQAYLVVSQQIRKNAREATSSTKSTQCILVQMCLTAIRDALETQDPSSVAPFVHNGRGVDGNMLGNDKPTMDWVSRLFRRAGSPDLWIDRDTEKYYMRIINKSGFAKLFSEFKGGALGVKVRQYMGTESCNWIGDIMFLLLKAAGHPRTTNWEEWGAFITDESTGARVYQSILKKNPDLDQIDLTDEPIQASGPAKAAKLAVKATKLRRIAKLATQGASAAKMEMRRILGRAGRIAKAAKKAAKAGKPAKTGKTGAKAGKPARTGKPAKAAVPYGPNLPGGKAKKQARKLAKQTLEANLPVPADEPADDREEEEVPAPTLPVAPADDESQSDGEEAPTLTPALAPAPAMAGLAPRALENDERVSLAQILSKTVEQHAEKHIAAHKAKPWPPTSKGHKLFDVVLEWLRSCTTETPVGFFTERDNLTRENIACLGYPLCPEIHAHIGPGKRFTNSMGPRWVALVFVLARKYFDDKPRNMHWLDLDVGFDLMMVAADHPRYELPEIWQELGPETQLSPEY